MRTLSLALLLLLPFALSAAAQPSPPPALAPVNCDALNQGTLLCVRNGTARPISKITCGGVGGMFSGGPVDLSIPHGIIRPGETTIVDFPRDKCSRHIVVFTRDGHQYPFDGFDTKNNTSLLVDNE